MFSPAMTTQRSMYYNFVRIHKTLRTTPAMAAKVTDRLWEIGDIVDVLRLGRPYRKMTSTTLSSTPIAVLITALSIFPGYAAQCGGESYQLKEPTLCSKLFEFAGRCGRGNYPLPDWTPDVAFAVGPWERVPIRIFAISADTIVRATWRAVIARMFLGNSFNADPMTPYVYASGGIMDLSGRVAVSVHAEQHYPIGMQLPGAGPVPLSPHLDVHLICEPNDAPYYGSMTVWYSLDEPPQSK
jgi:hypothetical protein